MHIAQKANSLRFMQHRQVKNLVSKRLFIITSGVLLVASAAPASLAQVSAASSPYSVSALSETAKGLTVTATTTLKATKTVTAQEAGICARSSSNGNVDFPYQQNVSITTTGTTVSKSETFQPGVYSYFGCLEVSGTWYAPGTSQVFGVVNPAPAGVLTQWQNSLTNRTSAPAVWMAEGDSITEGQGASSAASRWLNEATTNLRSAFPTQSVVGGVGYLPGWYSVYGPDSTYQPYSAETGAYDDTWGSLGDRIAVLGSGASQSYTVTGTSVDILYTTNGGTFTYSVDGGSSHSVNTAGTYTDANRVRVTFASAGIHTVKIAETSGTDYIEGVMTYNGDENKGIQMYDDAHTGYSTTDYNGMQGQVDPIMQMIKPNLVTIELGANDYLHDTSTPAQTEANLESEINNIETNMAGNPPSIVLVLPYDISDQPAPSSYTWAQYAAAIRSIPSAYPNVGLIDLSSVMSPASASGYWSSDGLHPSNSGQALISTIISSYLASQ